VTLTLERIHIMRSRLFLAPRLALLALAGAATLSACSDDTGTTAPPETRMYNQIQRLGNPLVSEVLLAKRSHPVHGSTGPKDDAATIGPEIVSFVTGVAGRDPAYANALGGVLLPDMLIVQTDKDPAAGDTAWTYTVGAAGGVKPHQVKQVAAVGPRADASRSFTTRTRGIAKRFMTTSPSTTHGRFVIWMRLPEAGPAAPNAAAVMRDDLRVPLSSSRNRPSASTNVISADS